MTDAEAHRRALERVGRRRLVVAPGADVLADHAEDLQPRLEGAAVPVLVLAGERRQEVEREVPLTRHDRVEALAHRVRVYVGDGARVPAAVRLRRAAVLR